MSSITTFRGANGEVVRSFTSTATILTALPILIIWIVVLVPAMFLTVLRARHGESSGDLYLTIIFTIVHASMVGRFALPATRGDLSRGFFDPELEWSEVIAFVGRYLAVSVGWALALWLIGKALVSQLTSIYGHSSLMFIGGGLEETSSDISYAFFAALLMLYVGLSLIGPLIAFLVAICAQSITDVFSGHVWRWIFWERAGDLPAFFASIIGAVIVIYIKVSIPMMFLAAIIGKGSSSIGFFLMIFAVTLPVLASPVLIGRMCGAFVFGADRLNSYPGKASLAGVDSAGVRAAGSLGGISSAAQFGTTGSNELDLNTMPADADLAPPTPRKVAGDLGELTIDPPNELLQRLREIGAKYPGMQRVHLCGGDPIVVVVELGGDLSLKDRQVIRNDLNSLTAIIESIRIEVPHEERLKKAQAVGLRVYERR